MKRRVRSIRSCCFVLFLAAFAGGVTGCAVNVQAVSLGVQLKPVRADQVKLYAGEPTRPPAMILGSVAVDVIGDGDDAAVEARRASGALGADAMIHVRLTKMTGYVVRTGISGLAVRMTP